MAKQQSDSDARDIVLSLDEFDPEANPVSHSREWLDGYVYRLEEADRARRFPDVSEADYLRIVNWAHDPSRDRRQEAVDVLLTRIREHPNPPYTPLVLLSEFEALNAIPPAGRLYQDFPARMHAWLDRAEVFLSLGQPAADDYETPADDDYEPSPDSREGRALEALAKAGATSSDTKISTDKIAKIAKRATDTGFPDANNFKDAVSTLNKCGFVDTRTGRGGGVWLTDKGFALVQRLYPETVRTV